MNAQNYGAHKRKENTQGKHARTHTHPKLRGKIVQERMTQHTLSYAIPSLLCREPWNPGTLESWKTQPHTTTISLNPLPSPLPHHTTDSNVNP